MPYFLDVALPIPIRRLFTYQIADEQITTIQRGMRVAVPFGKSKIYTAIAYQLHQNPPTAYEAKEIHEILDNEPIVSELQLEHWQWIAQYYMCTLGEVIRAGIPNTFLLESETQILSNQLSEIDENLLTDDEFLIVEALHQQSTLRIKDVMEITGRKQVLPLIHGLVQKEVIKLKEHIHEKYKPKQIKYVRLHQTYDSEHALEALLTDLQRAPKQSQVVLSYFKIQGRSQKPLKLKELEKESGVSKPIIKALVDKSVFEVYEIRTDRVVFERNINTPDDLVLNSMQTAALKDIETSFEKNQVTLLHGVTSSGKTAVYVKLIQKALINDKQVLFLLPEIALTSQLIYRLQTFFGNQIAVYHSRYSQNERAEVWKNVLQKTDQAKIVLGARSALLLPFTDLGLIIVDEEHEQSYKQFDPAPRYHGRDAAVYLAYLHQANCLLGSATPSIESYANACKGKYGLAKIKKRYGEVLMPKIELVDLKEAHRKKQIKGHFSEQLFHAIQQTLEAGEQVILFQNRRGFAPVLVCTTCGNTAQCPNCDVSLTFHQLREQLRCHYCGFHLPMPKSCQACGNSTLDYKGFGTEQVQEELNERLPKANVQRMDLDTTRGKYAYEHLIASFEAQEIDILVGTQMITKGLDFRNVGLVGIMDADNLLYFPDYRSHERSFQLLVQVAGRAGRTQKRGKVLIQTHNTNHQILKQVTKYQYLDFFQKQQQEREQFNYPPSVKILRITLKHKNFNRLNEASYWFANSLNNVLKCIILGPETPAISRIRGEYLKHILIKFNTKEPISQSKKSIKRVEQSFDAISKYRSVKIIYDVDHL